MSTLHITNGDSVRGTLREIVVEPIAITADPLFEGPAPADLEGPEWRVVRARYMAGESGDLYADYLQTLTEWDAALAAVAQYDEVVLWFEHDLFDQLLLIRTLHLLGRLWADSTHQPNLTLICIGEFPGVDRFFGLGQLTANQLATLLPTRQAVTEQQHQLAQEAWRVFRAPDPRGLVELVRRLTVNATTSAELPYLGNALRRFLQEYPSSVNGLSRSADQILRALGSESLTGLELFTRSQAYEEHPSMGDLSMFGIMRRLASARVPLVCIDGDPRDVRHARLRQTTAGHDVAAGRRDAVALNGIDEWRGGVHLVGKARSPWRWDPAANTLVS